LNRQDAKPAKEPQSNINRRDAEEEGEIQIFSARLRFNLYWTSIFLAALASWR